MTTRYEWLIALVATAGTLLAETPAAVSGKPQVPVVGFIATSAPLALRPVAGAPGAVVVGDAIQLPDQSVKLAVAPRQPYALLEQTGNAQISIVRAASGYLDDVVSIDGALSHWDRVAFSSSGQFAVLFNEADQKLQVLGGLPGQPSVRRNLDTGGTSDAPITALAVSDDGDTVALGRSDGTAGSVWLLAADGAARRLAGASNPSAMRFAPNSQDVLVGDRGSKQVSLLGNESRVLASDAQGINAPVDVEISADRQQVWVADAGAKALLVIQPDSGNVTTEACPYVPASFRRLDGKSVFLVVAQDDDGAGIWAPEAANTQVWRLPAGNRVE